jgi:RNA-directed DNA polymerase
MQLFAGMTESMATKLGFVAERAKRDRSATFDNLMHLINEESLKDGYQQLRKECAVGVDGISWKEYGERLEENIKGLMRWIDRMGYRPQAVKRVYIPKDNGDKRPLGIPAIEDKLVQKTMSWVMEAIYEQDFHGDSYGFRVGKSCHQALKRINDLVMTKPLNHVIEADIKGFFDNVEHAKLIEWLQVRIKDKRFVRYVVRFLKAGYMEEGAFKKTERGTPQGGNISPMIANMFLHYVVDEWFEKDMKPRMKGQAMWCGIAMTLWCW